MQNLSDEEMEQLKRYILDMRDIAVTNSKSLSVIQRSLVPFLVTLSKGSLGRITEAIAIVMEFAASTLIMATVLAFGRLGEFLVRRIGFSPETNELYQMFQWADLIAVVFTCGYLTLSLVIFFWRSIRIKVLLANAEVKRVEKSISSNH